MRVMKRFLATAVSAVVLVTGGVAVAGAATDSNDTDAPPAATDRSAATERSAKARCAPRRLRAVGPAAKAIGVERKELVAALRDGQTVAQVAEANGVDSQSVVDAIVEARTKRLTARAQRFVNEARPKRGEEAAARD